MGTFCRLRSFGVLPITLAGLCAHSISAQTVTPSGRQEHPTPWLNPVQESAIDQLFSRPSGTPGYAVALIKDGEFVFAKGYGLANLDDNIPITPETSFHLASLSKQFTAAAVALLILDHKIALSDPVAKYLPEASKSLAKSVDSSPPTSVQPAEATPVVHRERVEAPSKTG